MRAVLTALLLLGVAALGACTLLRGKPVAVEHVEGITATGVRWKDTFTGLGHPVAGSGRVTIHYTARVLGGSKIDSSYDRGRPESFSLALAPVLGWSDGIPGMRVGGRRKLIVPPERGYGDEGVEGVIPPRATLEFLIELVAIDGSAHENVP